MMNITNSYNPEERRVIVFVESNLLVDYFPNFSGLIKKNNSSISDIKVEKIEKAKAMISFPLPKEASVMKVSEEKMAVSMPMDIMEKLNKTINKFAKSAIRKKLRTVEFLPLFEYPEEDLKKDMEAAVKTGRNFCLLENYSDYLKTEKEHKFDFNQVFVYKGTNEYADIALDIWNGDIEHLRKKLEGKFERCEWI